MVVYSQSKIINFISKGCGPYLLGMTHVKFHNHSSSSLLLFVPITHLGYFAFSKL